MRWSCLLVCVVAGPSSGCGGARDTSGDQEKADAQLAREIEASAERHERERRREVRRQRTTTPAASTTRTPAVEAPPPPAAEPAVPHRRRDRDDGRRARLGNAEPHADRTVGRHARGLQQCSPQPSMLMRSRGPGNAGGGRTAVMAVLIAAVIGVPADAGGASTSLRGRTIVLDPGHNAGNASAPSAINRQVGIGQGKTKSCNTTGTATSSGYSEASYTWDVAIRARRVLRKRGAKVVLTRRDNRSVGPCVDERARIANRARADATVSIHADGAPPTGVGFHIIEPALIPGLTDDIFRASHRLAIAVRTSFRSATREPYANYIGTNGIDRRGDLGGLRLANVPAIFIETGNMRNASDERRMLRATYRLSVARGIANGVERFLR